jgi:hypothetical protein
MVQFGSSDGTAGSSGGDRTSREGSPAGGLHGGLVTETGIALVHEGETIRPRADSAAQVELAELDAASVINVNLPVVIEVVGRRDDGEMELTINETLRRLRHAIEAQA